jgi:hypothetical protein
MLTFLHYLILLTHALHVTSNHLRRHTFGPPPGELARPVSEDFNYQKVSPEPFGGTDLSIQDDSSSNLATLPHVGWLPQSFGESFDQNTDNIATEFHAAGSAMKRKRRRRDKNGAQGLDVQHIDSRGKPSNGWDPATRKLWNGMCDENGHFTRSKDLDTKLVDSPEDLKRFFEPTLSCKPQQDDDSNGDKPSCLNDPDLCLFTAAYDSTEYMMHWLSYCIQIDLPLATGFDLNIGLNVEMARGAGCDRKNIPEQGFQPNEDINIPDDKKCVMSLKGEASIGVTLGMPPLASVSVYLTGSFELSTTEGIPCISANIFADESWRPNIMPSKRCGHSRLFFVWLTHFLGNSGIFKDKRFTAAMYSSLVKNQAELKAESNRAEEQEEVMNIVSALNKETSLAFKPQNHPLYRAAKIWNIQFHKYWLKAVIEDNDILWKQDLAAHRHFQNRRVYKAAIAKFDNDPENNSDLTTKKIYVTAGDDPKQFGKQGKEQPKDGMSSFSEKFNENKIISKMATLKNKLKKRVAKIDTLPFYINFEKSFLVDRSSAKDVQRLFIWYVRYILETSVLQYFFSNPNKHAKKPKYLTLESYNGIRAGSGPLYDPSLKYCSSLPVLFDGEISGDRLSDYVENADEFKRSKLKKIASFGGKYDDLYFEGRSQMLCLFGKDISKISTFRAGRPRYHRKSCNCDNTYECTECKKNKHGEKEFINICNENQQGSEEYSRILSTKEECDPNNLIEDQKLIDQEDMNWEIPLWSANVFPSIAKEAYLTLKKMKKIKNVDQMKEIFINFRIKLKETIPMITQDWNAAFSVLPIKETVEKCSNFPIAPCESKTLNQVLTGAVFHTQSNYISTLQNMLKENTKLLATLNNNKLYPEEIDWVAELIVGATFGGAVGFCTPDTNWFQFTAPTTSWSGTINSRLGDSSIQTEYGGEVVFTISLGSGANTFHFQITVGGQRQISERAPYHGEIGLKVYMPIMSIDSTAKVSKEGVYSSKNLNEAGPKAVELASFLIPTVVKFIDMGFTMWKDNMKQSQEPQVNEPPKQKISFFTRMKKYFMTLKEKFTSRPFWEFMGISPKASFLETANKAKASAINVFNNAAWGVALGKGMMAVFAGIKADSYIMINVNLGFDYSAKNLKKEASTEFKTGKHSKTIKGLTIFLDATASFLNFVSAGFLDKGTVSRGNGVVVDLGILMNRMYSVTRTKFMTKSTEEADEDLTEKRGSAWVDTRTVLCRECTRQVERLRSSTVDCEAIDTLMAIAANNDDGDNDDMTYDDAKALCNAVFNDMTSFLAADKSSIFFSKTKQQKKAKAKFVTEYNIFGDYEEAGNLGPKCNVVKSPYCEEMKFCEYSGVGCFGFGERLKMWQTDVLYSQTDAAMSTSKGGDEGGDIVEKRNELLANADNFDGPDAIDAVSQEAELEDSQPVPQPVQASIESLPEIVQVAHVLTPLETTQMKLRNEANKIEKEEDDVQQALVPTNDDHVANAALSEQSNPLQIEQQKLLEQGKRYEQEMLMKQL